MADPETDTAERPPRNKGGGPKKGARASIQVDDIPLDEGAASDVLGAASGRRRGGAPAGDQAAQKFSRAIRNPVNRIVAARLQPQTMGDGTPLGDTLELPCHETQSIDEIKKDIQEARGGRKWIIRVYDEDEHVIASRSENINGMPRLDPMLENLDNPQEEEPMQTGPELTEEELLEERLAKDPEVVKALKEERLDEIRLRRIQRQGELAEAEARLKKARGEDDPHRTNGNGKHKRDADDDDDRLTKAIEAATAPLRAANEQMQRDLADEKRRSSEKESREERRRELEAVTGPLKSAQEATQRALDAIAQKLAEKPPAGPTPEALMAKLEAVKNEIQRDTTQQITNAINQATTTFNAKVDALNNTINLMATKGGKDPAVMALIALATKSGTGGQAADPFSGMLKAMEVMNRMKAMTGETGNSGPADFPSYLVEKMAEMTPEVLNFFKERGSLPTKEEVNAQMKAAAMKMYENLDASMKQALDEGFKRLRGLPSGQPGPAPSPAPSAAPAPAPDVTVQPSAPSAAPSVVSFPGAPAPAGSSPAASAPAELPTDSTPTPAQLFAALDAKDRTEYARRVNWVLAGMLREMEIGAVEMQWPQQAHGNLPRKVVEQIVEATSDKDIYEIVKPYADAAVLGKIWKYLSPTNKQHEWYQDWLAAGINWIKKAEGLELEEPTGEEPVVDD